MHDRKDFSFPIKSKNDDISSFLEEKGDVVVFCTYQSSKKIAIALKNKNIRDFDLIIAD